MRGWVLGFWCVCWAALVAVCSTGVAGAAHPHDEPERAAVVELGQVYAGSNEGATGEALSHCGFHDTCDVWHQFTAPGDGLFEIRIVSHSFGTVLSVFDPCDMAELACSDRMCLFGPPQVQMLLPGGSRLLIRVAGYGCMTGVYELLVSRITSDALSCIMTPSPADGAEGVPLDSGLRWDGLPAHVAAPRERIAAAKTSGIKIATIYGSDDRRDAYEVREPDLLEAGRAVAMIVTPDRLIHNADGTVTLFSGSLAEAYVLRTGRLLCPEERFRDQPAPGKATGFLVAPQVLATVGHVVACEATQGLGDVVVFDYTIADANIPNPIVRPEQLYTMKKVLAYNDGIPDWALVELDRPVMDRKPLRLRRQGRLADDVNDLVVIGHPLGLPHKYSTGGNVRDNNEPAFFQTDLDVNAGNSGSPILRKATLEVEGILFSGNEDFVAGDAYGGRCDCSLVCPDEEGRCAGWEWITRATHFSALIPAYDVYLGQDPNGLSQVASTLNVPWYAPRELLKNTTYYWQVRARTVDGVPLSPIWSFTTQGQLEGE